MSAVSAEMTAAALAVLEGAYEPLSARDVAEALRCAYGTARRALVRLRAESKARYADWLPQRGVGGRPVALYDTRVELGDVPFVALTPAEIKVRVMTRVRADPARQARYLESRRRNDADRRERNRPAQRPAFDPRTAINWRRAA